MGVKGKSKYEGKLKVGDKIGKWTITGDLFLHKDAKVEVTCECGSKFNRSIYSLLVGTSKSCYPCSMKDRSIGGENTFWKGYNNVPGSFTQRYIRKCKQKEDNRYTWEIDIRYIDNLFLKQEGKCALTGLPISFINTAQDYSGYSCTASLDRIDSNKGYIEGNVQLLHKDVNLMKNHFDEKYFIHLCKLIANGNVD